LASKYHSRMNEGNERDSGSANCRLSGKLWVVQRLLDPVV